MIRVALKGLAGRKLRAALTAIAIVLGVAMLSGTYVLTDTIDKAFDSIFVESYAGTDAVVTGHKPGIRFEGDEAETPPVPEAILERVRAVEGVEVATGTVFDESTKILDDQGKAIDTQGAPTFGFGIDTSPELERFNPLNLAEGRWPAGPREVAIDRGTADDEHYDLGDSVGVAAVGPRQTFRVVGIAQYGSVSSLGSATFAVFDIPTAQRLLDKEGTFDAISAAAKEGVEPAALVDEIRRALPGTLDVKSGVEQASDDKGEVAEFTKFIRYFLLAFAGIAIFVGAFVIFNTLSITVAQRAREFATLRTLGASRRQVLGSVVVEALVIGTLASLSGLFLGLALAKGLNSLFVSLGLDLPQTGIVFQTRTIVVSLVVGIGVTLLAGLAPAVRATRVPPIAAVREGSTLPRSRLAPYSPYIALLTIAAAVAMLVYSMFGSGVAVVQRLLLMALGCLALFFGIALFSSRLVRPLARVVGWPATAIGGAAGKLAQSNARRNPGRTAATAAALMIGLALVTFVAVLADGFRTSNSKAINEQVIADYVVTSQNGFEPFVAAAGDAVERARGTELVTHVRSDLAKAAGSGKYLTGIEPDKITRAYRFDWHRGSDVVLSLLGANGAIVAKDFAEDKGLEIGGSFEILTPSSKRRTLEVKGIYDPPPFYPLLGAVSVTKDTFDALYDRPRNQFTFANVAGHPSEATTKALSAAVASFPDARVLTRKAWVADQEQELSELLNLLYVLLALSVIVSLFGMVNTLVLSVFERTRELGMLRAVGMTRRQVRRMIRHESVITALIGAALGLPLGVFLAFLVIKALGQWEITFSLPVGSLIVFTIVSIIAGMLAAILPARRAARLNVLEALQYE
ncbi:MAG: ABC transporter permease [Gaiellaceae bacterium]